MDKITVVGAGNVGATAAQRLAEKELAREVVLIDIAEGIPQGKGLDQWESAPIEGFDSRIIGSNGYEEAAGSGIFIVTAGIARKPGMSRDDLLATNVKIVSEVAAKSAQLSPNAIMIVVSNPLDAMVYAAWKASGFPTHRVMGQAGVLDVARYTTFLATEIGCSVQDVSALLMGGHGDDMVPLIRYTTVSGIPVTQLVPAGKLDDIVKRARNGGAEIVGLLKTGSAYYAPASATIAMVESIVRDKKRVLACAAYCEKEYGVGGYFVGVPCILGTNGVERVIEVELDAREREMFNTSVSHVKELVAATEKLLTP